MARTIPEQELRAIEIAVRQQPDGASLDQIERALAAPMPRRTLQHRLKHLVSKDRLSKTGERRWARYRVKSPADEQVIGGEARVDAQGALFIPVSKRGAEIQDYVRKPLGARKPVGMTAISSMPTARTRPHTCRQRNVNICAESGRLRPPSSRPEHTRSKS